MPKKKILSILAPRQTLEWLELFDAEEEFILLIFKEKTKNKGEQIRNRGYVTSAWTFGEENEV